MPFLVEIEAAEGWRLTTSPLCWERTWCWYTWTKEATRADAERVAADLRAGLSKDVRTIRIVEAA